MALLKENLASADKQAEKQHWLHKLGLVGIIFFTIKGMLWLAAFILLAFFGIKI